MSEQLGLREVVAMGVGGLIGGGIFAVLGVAADIAGTAAFLAYLIAGVVAMASGYSYARLTAHLEEEGGSFTFVEHYTGNENVAGLVGWTLIVGYVGTMAMYAFAFGSFAAELLAGATGTWLRIALSIGVVVVFTGVNLMGVRESGESQDVLVYVKVVILVAFGLVGLWAIFLGPGPRPFAGGVFSKGLLAPIVSIGAIFVSFEGFQLLAYEYTDIEGRIDTMETGIYLSIAISTVIYVLVAFVTTVVLTPEQILQSKETVLAVAASMLFTDPLIQRAAFVLVSIAALFSTTSAINATLFGTARLAHKIASEGALPKLFSFRNQEGVPVWSLVVIGGLTAVFTSLGTLEEITSFASIAFALVFGTVNYICLRDPGTERSPWIPGLGLVGTASFVLLILWYYLRTQPAMLSYVGGIFLALVVLEVGYSERRRIELPLRIRSR
ncbi:APC family permease [Haloarchaeobius sp. HRN-SO-5]|uniref:APC family permease n=1 Tax=Haloarchaeobius sp. HRN-SO-5 TaxID=3446118 RepID=UPI003EBD69B8